MNNKVLRRTVAEFRNGILGWRHTPHGMCFAVSAPLQAYLYSVGVETQLVQGLYRHSEHWWLQLTDGRIIDATADQFGTRKSTVYIGKQPRHYKLQVSS